MAFYLVTGGAGFIGSSLVRRLLARGDKVRVVDDFSTGLRSNLEEVRSRIELIEGDLADLDVARKAADGVQFILHQGAIPSVPRSIEDPISCNRSIVTATMNLLVSARDAKVKRFVYASSSSVYGNSKVLPKVETMPENPISPYALAKLTGEKYCRMFYEIYGLPTVCLRYFNVFGPRQDPNSPYSAVISSFVDSSLNGRQPRVHGDGEQSRDFTFVENVVEANLLSCTAEGAAGKAFNIGTGKRHTLNKVLRDLSEIVGSDLKPQYVDSRPGDVRHSLADIGQARTLLGYDPQVSFEEGLRRTVEWVRANQEKAAA